MNKGGFSVKRAVGITNMKRRISMTTGIPLTKSGRQRKIGAALTGAAYSPGAYAASASERRAAAETSAKGCLLSVWIVCGAVAVICVVVIFNVIGLFNPPHMTPGSFNVAIEQKVDHFFTDFDMGYIVDMRMDMRDASMRSVIVNSSRKGEVLMVYNADWVLQKATNVEGTVLYYPTVH